MSLASLYPQLDRTTWLAQRQSGIGASEAAAVIGINPWQTPLDVYLRKVNPVEDRPPTLRQRIGLAQEPTILKLYEEETGRKVSRSQVFLVSPAYPHLIATLDGVGQDGRIVEFKTASEYSASDWEDGIPEHYMPQVQQQMLVAGEDVADVAVLIGQSNFLIHTVERDQEYIEDMLPLLAEFWNQVQERRPPDPTFRDLEALGKLAPAYADTIELGSASMLSLRAYLQTCEELKVLETSKSSSKSLLLQDMQSHARAIFPDGTVITRKEVSRKEYTVKATSYFDLRISRPKGGAA